MAVGLACMAIEAGLCKAVVCGYGRDSWSRTRSPEAKLRVALIPEAQQAKEFGPEFGFFGAAAMHGLGARRHMHEYGTSREQMGDGRAGISRTCPSQPGCANGRVAEHGSIPVLPLDRRAVLPVRLQPGYRRRRRGHRHVRRPGEASATAAGSHSGIRLRQQPARLVRGRSHDPHCRRAKWTNRLSDGGDRPKDVDTAQIYDCFTYMVLVQLEDYGFCKKGEGGEFAASGSLNLDGELPCNTSGGQLSEGHVEGCFRSSKRRDNFVTSIRPIGK